jgi:DNA-binding transcriptional ArsR family regulator/uncharacterized protein YndB with AHSA1/START domain
MTDGPEPDLDAVFKALNDPTRRAILDALRARDGQSLTEIESDRALSRFGVMKHLKVLEDAGLVIPRRSGRFKHHFLNAVPLQQVIDRWIDPFVQKPLARLSLDLKTRLEGNAAMTDADAKPDFMLQTFIRCSPDALWEALTRADLMALYHFACDRVRGDAEPGATTEFLGADGSTRNRAFRGRQTDEEADGPDFPDISRWLAAQLSRRHHPGRGRRDISTSLAKKAISATVDGAPLGPAMADRGRCRDRHPHDEGRGPRRWN